MPQLFDITTGKTIATINRNPRTKKVGDPLTKQDVEFLNWFMGLIFGEGRIAVDLKDGK